MCSLQYADCREYEKSLFKGKVDLIGDWFDENIDKIYLRTGMWTMGQGDGL